MVLRLAPITYSRGCRKTDLDYLSGRAALITNIRSITYSLSRSNEIRGDGIRLVLDVIATAVVDRLAYFTARKSYIFVLNNVPNISDILANN